MFAGHEEHVSADVAPSALEYVPSAHAVHASRPSQSLYVPRGQLSHDPEASYFPGRQEQLESSPDPSYEVAPEGHAAMCCPPRQYEPAGHSSHSTEPSSGPVE